MLNAVGTPMLGASKKCHGGIRLAFEVFEIIGKASVLLDGIVMKPRGEMTSRSPGRGGIRTPDTVVRSHVL
jgi:hypothetical protein